MELFTKVEIDTNISVYCTGAAKGCSAKSAILGFVHGHWTFHGSITIEQSSDTYLAKSIAEKVLLFFSSLLTYSDP